jgi:hypothetical protein
MSSRQKNLLRRILYLDVLQIDSGMNKSSKLLWAKDEGT